MQLNAKILRFSDYELHLQQTNLTLFTSTVSSLHIIATSNNLKKSSNFEFAPARASHILLL